MKYLLHSALQLERYDSVLPLHPRVDFSHEKAAILVAWLTAQGYKMISNGADTTTSTLSCLYHPWIQHHFVLCIIAPAIFKDAVLRARA